MLGGLGGAAVAKWGTGFGYGMLAAGGAYSIATGHGDSFAGGLAGSVAGWGIGKGILSIAFCEDRDEFLTNTFLAPLF